LDLINFDDLQTGPPKFHIHPFHSGDESTLHAIFHFSMHEMAYRHYTVEQLQACEGWVKF